MFLRSSSIFLLAVGLVLASVSRLEQHDNAAWESLVLSSGAGEREASQVFERETKAQATPLTSSLRLEAFFEALSRRAPNSDLNTLQNASVLRRRAELLTQVCANGNWMERLQLCTPPTASSARQVPTLTIDPVSLDSEVSSSVSMQEIARTLNGTWRGDDYQLRVDAVRAQANDSPAPFGWERFSVRLVTTTEITFTVGAELFQAARRNDEIILTSTSFRGERVLRRVSE
jgi:hypothetical protein